MLELLDNMHQNEPIEPSTLSNMIVRAALMAEEGSLENSEGLIGHLLDARQVLIENDEIEEDYCADGRESEKVYTEEWVAYITKHMQISRERALDNYTGFMDALPYGKFPTKLLKRVARAVACRDCQTWRALAALDEKARIHGVESVCS